MGDQQPLELFYPRQGLWLHAWVGATVFLAGLVIYGLLGGSSVVILSGSVPWLLASLWYTLSPQSLLVLTPDALLEPDRPERNIALARVEDATYAAGWLTLRIRGRQVREQRYALTPARAEQIQARIADMRRTYHNVGPTTLAGHRIGTTAAQWVHAIFPAMLVALAAALSYEHPYGWLVLGLAPLLGVVLYYIPQVSDRYLLVGEQVIHARGTALVQQAPVRLTHIQEGRSGLIVTLPLAGAPRLRLFPGEPILLVLPVRARHRARRQAEGVRCAVCGSSLRPGKVAAPAAARNEMPLCRTCAGHLRSVHGR